MPATSQWHRDAIDAAAMAQQTVSGMSVLEFHNFSAVRELADKKARNRSILLKLLKTFFYTLRDECQDISSQEELSVCCRWLVDGSPEEHFLTVLHVKATNAETIAAAITSFIDDNNLNYLRLVGQGYDEAATLAGKHTGVRRRIRAKVTQFPFHSLLMPRTSTCFNSSSSIC